MIKWIRTSRLSIKNSLCQVRLDIFKSALPSERLVGSTDFHSSHPQGHESYITKYTSIRRQACKFFRSGRCGWTSSRAHSLRNSRPTNLSRCTLPLSAPCWAQQPFSLSVLGLVSRLHRASAATSSPLRTFTQPVFHASRAFRSASERTTREKSVF